jgi:hypothetical protein
VTALQSKPGRHLMSVRQSSFNAWRFDRVTLRQHTNLKATTISYYNKGELIGWLLDLDIRARTHGQKTLDDVMRLMWRRFWLGPRASYYLQGRGAAVRRDPRQGRAHAGRLGGALSPGARLHRGRRRVGTGLAGGAVTRSRPVDCGLIGD